MNTDQDAALLEGIGEQHGERPALIMISTAEQEYDPSGILDLVTGTKHYGNVLGSNEFDDTRLGVVIGSNHYGDHYIQKWGAYAGKRIERNDEKGSRLSYGPFGDRVLAHMREHDTLQAAMRFCRDRNGTVVYVHTDTLPEWVPLAGEGRALSTWSAGMEDVLIALEDFDGATTADIAEHPAVDLSRRQVFTHLERPHERGVLARQQVPHDGRRLLWRADGLHRLGEHGDVDLEELSDNEVQEVVRTVSYTWDFRNLASPTRPSAESEYPGGPEPSSATSNGGERPPSNTD